MVGFATLRDQVAKGGTEVRNTKVCQAVVDSIALEKANQALCENEPENATPTDVGSDAILATHGYDRGSDKPGLSESFCLLKEVNGLRSLPRAQDEPVPSTDSFSLFLQQEEHSRRQIATKIQQHILSAAAAAASAEPDESFAWYRIICFNRTRSVSSCAAKNCFDATGIQFALTRWV